MDGIIIMLLSFIQPSDSINNRFTALFNKEDSTFNKEYHLDIEALRRSSEEAAKETDEKTKHLKPKIPTIRDLIGDSLLNEFNKNDKRFAELWAQ